MDLTFYSFEEERHTGASEDFGDDSLHPNRSQVRLSPVSESQQSLSFEMVTPAPRAEQDNLRKLTKPVMPSLSPNISFTRKRVAPAKSQPSALSAMLNSTSSGSSNPFAELYAAISGRAETSSLNVRVFFPEARGQAMELTVRKDATVEEVVGYSLWSYWEEGLLPRLDEGLAEDDPKREIRLSAVGWIMRLAEEDGEYDDFPRKCWSFPDSLFDVISPRTICEDVKAEFRRICYLGGYSRSRYASGYKPKLLLISVVAHNQQLASKIQRRPSRTVKAANSKAEKSQPTLLAPILLDGPSTSAIVGSNFGSMLSTSLGPSSSHGPQIFLRIRVVDSTPNAHVSTTIPV